MTALTAALAATAVFAAPVPVGTATSSNQAEGALSIQADPVEGAWISFTSPQGERLVRVHEDGRVTPIELPPKLRGQGLGLTPLASGWTVAVDQYWPGGPAEEQACEPVGSGSRFLALRMRTSATEEPRCGELVVAQLSPGGRWTRVQSLPDSFGRESQASEAAQTPDGIELAWTPGEDFAPIRVAVARPGRAFGRPHLAREPLHREANRILFPVLQGALYLRGEYAPNPPFGTVRFWVDRLLHGDGTLGPPHFIVGYVVREPGLSLEGADGSELWIWGEVFSPLKFAWRARGATTFERPRLIVKESDGGEEFTQSHNHRTLISLDTPLGAKGSRISAVEIYPDGRLGPLLPVEPQSESPEEHRWASAINDAGSVLIATTGGEMGHQLWLRASGGHCVGFGTRALLSSTNERAPMLSAGRRGVFHVAWIDAQHQVQTSSARVRCGA